MTTTIEGVSVELGRQSGDWRKLAIFVKVRSQTKKQLQATNEVDPGLAGSVQGVLQLVGAAGGACAEYLDSRYKDQIDPEHAAKCAMHAFAEECRRIKETAKTVPEKLKRLRTQVAHLADVEREFVERASWLVEHGQDLNLGEADAIDTLIARLHGSQL